MRQCIFLVEIGTEELPAKILRRLGELFAKNVKNECKKINIIYERIIWYASVRRLSIRLINVKVRGDNFCCDLDQKKDVENVTQSSLQYDRENIKVLLSSVVSDSLTQFSFSTTMMRWKDHNMRFIRPVRTFSMLFDHEVIVSDFLGIPTSRVVRGHPFMGKQEVIIDHAKNYEELLLKKGCVIVDYEHRKQIIRCEIENIIKNIDGRVDYSSGLLEEVTAISEWPVVLLGSFDEKFLYIPYEILLYVMIVRKKYFPVYDINKKLLPYFIFVIDIVVNNPKKIIIAHERVLNSCFSDAKFFLDRDKQYRLENNVSRLHTVSFHKKLGNLYEKTIRIKILSSWLANKIGVDMHVVKRAAILSKCDLLSHVVYEFPFSKGIVGMYYARRDGEREEVALAQKEQYFPRFFSDVLPSTKVSCILSISDKIDTISGVFLIGEYPTGGGDPMGLRRFSIAVLRVIIEKKITISLCDLLEQSLSLYKNFSIVGCMKKIVDFMYKRLCVMYTNRGYTINLVRATLSDTLNNLVDFNERISAVNDFFILEDSRLLFLMYKRIFNILKGVPDFFQNIFKYKFKYDLLVEYEEIFLSEKLLIIRKKFLDLCHLGHYYDALVLLLTLCTPVENFFKNVTIMSSEEELCLNRLMLLSDIWFLLFHVMNSPHHMFDADNFIKLK